MNHRRPLDNFSAFSIENWIHEKESPSLKFENMKKHDNN